MSARVLLVDDEAPVRFAVGEVLRDAGYVVQECDGVPSALPHLSQTDVVVSDLSMPGRSGLDLLDEVRSRDANQPFILLTARGNERVAVTAMKKGAWDYLSKPFDNEELLVTVQRAVERVRLLQSDARRFAQNDSGQWLVGEAPRFLRLLSDAECVAQRDIPVLLLGETGTGKEAIASLIHAHSKRRARPLIRFNCAALTESLAEAELFGHERGAFTGAAQRREGFFQRADGGTLVLDEVVELPTAVQSKLLRALQQGEVQRVGASNVERVDVRVVACTSAPLPDKVAAGEFRADLFYRLAVVQLVVPPLRERREDIPRLVRHFQLKYRERFELNDVPLPDDWISALVELDWPGNVRELENVVAELMAFSDDGRVPQDALRRALERRSSDARAGVAPGDDPEASLRQRVDHFERTLIERALVEASGNQSEAARVLHTTRTTLLDKMKRLGLRSRA